MDKKFYEYAQINELSIYPSISEVVYPHCPTWGDEEEVFLVYAENKEEAFNLAMSHLYDGKPFERFYGIYKGERYNGVKCVM